MLPKEVANDSCDAEPSTLYDMLSISVYIMSVSSFSHIETDGQITQTYFYLLDIRQPL